MRIGYARVSTEDQTLDLQRDALKRAKCRQVYEEQATGKNIARPQLEACLKSLREGDTLIVWRLDRLGRNLADLVGLISELEQRKINFEFRYREDRNHLPSRPARLSRLRRTCRVRAQPHPGTNRRRPHRSSRSRSHRRKTAKAHTQRDQDHPSPPQISRNPRRRNRRPLPYRPFHPLPGHPQACRLTKQGFLATA